MKKTIMVVTTLALSVIVGCGTWHGLGKDIGRTGDAMAGEGKYVMTVHATPDQVTKAARKAVEQLSMTDINSSFDEGKGEVTARTAKLDSVKIEIEQSGATDSKVTIKTHGGDADDISKQIQDRIRSNL
jgi:predicted small secreted protein